MFSFWNNIFLNADLCILKVKHFQCHRHVLFTMTCYNFKMDFNCTLLLCYHNDIYFWQNKRIELQSQRCLKLVQLGHSLLPSFHNMRSNKEGRFKNDIVITSDYFSSSINSSVFKKIIVVSYTKFEEFFNGLVLPCIIHTLTHHTLPLVRLSIFH